MIDDPPVAGTNIFPSANPLLNCIYSMALKLQLEYLTLSLPYNMTYTSHSKALELLDEYYKLRMSNELREDRSEYLGNV